MATRVLQLTGIVMVILLMTSSPTIGQTIDDDLIELKVVVNTDNLQHFEIAIALKAVLKDFGFKLLIETVPEDVYHDYLWHRNSATPFDLTFREHSVENVYPTFMKYHSNSTEARQIYQLNNPDWQAFMESDIGISTAEMDALIEEIQYERDLLQRRVLTNQFAEVFMNQLLYELPILTNTLRIWSWKGYNYPNGDTYDSQNTMVGERKMGVDWDPSIVPQIRANQADKDTMQLQRPEQYSKLHPYLLKDSQFRDLLYEPLIDIDYYKQPHSALAYQWIQDRNYTRNIFLINDQFQFPATTISDGTNNIVYNQLPVTAKDHSFTLSYLQRQLQQNPNTRPFEDSGFTSFISRISQIQVNSTFNVDDTLILEIDQPEPGEYVYFDQIFALPAHIFNQTLHMQSENGITEVHLLEDTIALEETIEGKNWMQYSNHSSVGAMQVTESDMEKTIMETRADYPFPNRYDLEIKLEGIENPPQLSIEYNSSKYMPHKDGVESSLIYWNFLNLQSTPEHEKPTSQLIETVIFREVDDLDKVDLFEAGLLDQIVTDKLHRPNTVMTYPWNPDYVVSNAIEATSAISLVFNIRHEELQKRNVRYAIASAIDKTELVKTNDGFSTPGHTPVAIIFDIYTPHEFINAAEDGRDLSWYSPYPIPYNTNTTRDLLNIESYVGDPPSQSTTVEALSTIDGYLQVPILPLLVALGSTMSITYIKRKNITN